MPYILVDSFPELGKLVAYRFLEWVIDHPDGVISLPTGKTPEYFIKWMKNLLDNWNEQKVLDERRKLGFSGRKHPDLSKLQFVQIDEFYPISPEQHNSFCYYVNKFYIEDFGMDPDRALLINCDQIPLAQNKSFKEIFPDYLIDTSLRYREAISDNEKLRQEFDQRGKLCGERNVLKAALAEEFFKLLFSRFPCI